MMTRRFIRLILLGILFVVLPLTQLLAANESYVQSITGHLKKGDSVTVIDDKFLNMPLQDWNRVKHMSIQDVVAFELRQDTTLDFYKMPFSCKLNVTIKYFTSRDQTSPKEIDNVDLEVKYDTVKGKSYPMIARYRFKDAFKITVVINSISSPEWKDKLPDVFRLKAQIEVERNYPFDETKKPAIHLGAFVPLTPSAALLAKGPSVAVPDQTAGVEVNVGTLPVNFTMSTFPEYDIEWTFIDNQSQRGAYLYNLNQTQGNYNMDPALASQWMQHDATRVTVTSSPYNLNLPYLDGYVLVRIRGVSYPDDPSIPNVTAWSYTESDNVTFSIKKIGSLNDLLNWQYTGAFAEGGKKKEVISYFDGALRDRQDVTVSNGDQWTDANNNRNPTATVAETIYDAMGRATLQFLPGPTTASSLNFYPHFNQNATGTDYSYSDLANPTCHINAAVAGTSSGTSMYYSPNNGFLALNKGDVTYTKYVPNAQGYPFSVTEYTPDNTGRLRRQGGVGGDLQTASGKHSTNYYYSKPTQTELERLFGMEAGNSSHYIKNMVVDPNGQASVTYIDANGKTVATALSGDPQQTKTLDAVSDETASTPFTDVLIKPTDFTVNPLQLKMSATAVYAAELANQTYQLIGSINPLALVTQYGTNGANQLCNNCYYTVGVTVTDQCGQSVPLSTSSFSPPFQINDFTCHLNPTPVTINTSFASVDPGEYTITYTLQLSNDVINAQTDYYVQTNTDLHTLDYFFAQELQNLDLSGCYSSCDACKSLTSLAAFTAKIQQLFPTTDYPSLNLQDPAISAWISSTFQNLQSKCSALSCVTSPCEQKLQQLEQDVMPGGQYALYDVNAMAAGATTNLFLEPAINVMTHYTTDNVIAQTTFTADDGSTMTIGSLNQADFIHYYLENPGWAAMFVTYHIEYCSYMWCKDATYTPAAYNNEVSYTFDANLQQNFQSGQDAVNAGYYNHSDPLALLKKDPWFNSSGRGYTYYNQMASDLNNLSTVLHMTPTFGSTTLSTKGIIALDDWLLYCKPTTTGATQDQVTTSWNSCTVNDNCRSVSMEWQLYLQYYEQLKGKYYTMAKYVNNPSCLSCFIGSDPASASGCSLVGSISDYHVVLKSSPSTYGMYLVYKDGTVPIPGNYTFSYSTLSYLDGSVSGPYTIQTNAGDMQETFASMTLQPGQQGVFQYTEQLLGFNCTPPAISACVASLASVTTTTPVSCPTTSYFQVYAKESSDGCEVYSPGSPPAAVTAAAATSAVASPASAPGGGGGSNCLCPNNISNYYLRCLASSLPGGATVTVHLYENTTTTSGTTVHDLGTTNYTLAGPGSEVFVGTEKAVSGDVTQGCSPFNYYFVIDKVVCNGSGTSTTVNYPPDCTSNPNYALYQYKTRIFNNYIDYQDYASCYANSISGTTEQTADAQALANALQAETSNLTVAQATWLSLLQGVNSEEFGNAIPDASIQNLVNNLQQISSVALQVAAANGDALGIYSSLPATLPSGYSAPNGYHSFMDAFNAIVPGWVAKGFSPDLILNVYPYGISPVPADYTADVLSPSMYANLQANMAYFTSAAASTDLATYMAAQLGDDYLMTADQLADIKARMTNGCSYPYLANPTILPVALTVSPAMSHTSCSVISGLQQQFTSLYSGVVTGTKLYDVLLPAYLNHQLGYGLSFSDYTSFSTQCVSNSAAVLYDKPEEPTVVTDYFACAANQLKQTYAIAGAEYDAYITEVRLEFRNAYISKCLGNQTTMTIGGNKQEYHYTLYYYDQSGNLVKTIPPDGVRLLTDNEVSDVETIPTVTSSSCPDLVPLANSTVAATIASTMGSNIAGGSLKAMEAWLYGSNSTDRHGIIVASNYVVQFAITGEQAWVQVYSITGSTVTLVNQGVGVIPDQLPTYPYTHLFVNAASGLASGALQIYVDGVPCNMLTSNLPANPDGFTGTAVPSAYTDMIRQVRFYNSIASDQEILHNFQNSCMTIKDATLNAKMTYWGLYNAPSICNSFNPGQTQAFSIANKGSLSITSNPDTAGASEYPGLTSVSGNFTVEFWVNPNSTCTEALSKLTNKYGGIRNTSSNPYDNIPYVVFPGNTLVTGQANMAVAVGANGISVLENSGASGGFLAIVLQYWTTISGWTHIAVVYSNNKPSLYVNGSAVTPNATSYTKVSGDPTVISPSYNFGGGNYGSMRGQLDEVRIWNVARTAAQIQAAMNQSLTNTPTDNVGLVGYWPMDNTDATDIKDISCTPDNSHFYPAAETWLTTGAPITETRYVEFAPRFIAPNHGLPTNYAYNSFNSVVQQASPDAGTSNYFYDNLGRLVASQSSEQLSPAIPDANNVAGRYSYTKYDALNRVVEVGEKVGAPALTELTARTPGYLANTWLPSGTNNQVTLTTYDDIPAWAAVALAPNYTRKRITATALLTSGSNGAVNRQAATYFKYDIDGNVSEQVQENSALINDEKQLVTGATGLKDIKYQYDLISQKVNKVLYQDGKWDEFYYQYVYDDDNRVVGAYSSRFNSTTLSDWNQDAAYTYYHHGPLARTGLGIVSAQGIQGLDYAYTLQGWLKGVNGQQLSTDLTTTTDISGDGVTGSTFQNFQKDAIAYSLGYFTNDYSSIGGSSSNVFGSSFNVGSSTTSSGQSLYNGNIGSATYAIAPFEYPAAGSSSTTGFAGYSYRYDQLNRLTAMDHQVVTPYSSTASWVINPSNVDYKEAIIYDGNGNIRFYNRNGLHTTAQGSAMDQLSYAYNWDANGKLINNKLRHINDAVKTKAAATDPQDITDQASADYYVYDKVGNLKKENDAIADQQITNINWTPYGKMSSITKGDLSSISYLYDALGKRITKTYAASSTSSVRTHYVYDATGNVLAVYQYKGSSPTTATEGDWLEQHLYGSSRLGTVQPHVAILSSAKLANDAYNSSTDQVDQPGNRLYELTNHLGNVLATINDVAVLPTRSPLSAIMGANDYYPFGMQMPGRTTVASGSLNYRYGFNGKENDNEVKGVGDQIDYGMRVYDPRAGRFLSVDPLSPKYPELTPYQYASNRPIDGVDQDGLEYISTADANISSAQKNKDNSYTLTIGGLTIKSPGIVTYNGANYYNLGKNLYKTNKGIALSGTSDQKITSFFVTPEQMKVIFPAAKADVINDVASSLNKNMADYGVDNYQKLSQFFGQVGAETYGLREFVEGSGSLSKSYQDICSEFKKGEFNDNTGPYVRNQASFANWRYRSVAGNRGFESGDGYNFRGRGLFQLTGRGNYDDFNKFYNKKYGSGPDFLTNASLLGTNMNYATINGLWYFSYRVGTKLNLSSATVKEVTLKVNGGINGLKTRQQFYNTALKALY